METDEDLAKLDPEEILDSLDYNEALPYYRIGRVLEDSEFLLVQDYERTYKHSKTHTNTRIPV